ncbi:hypothetical protein B0H10DRAFT_1975757, partial [Mycena sp. CBHHK59/15]
AGGAQDDACRLGVRTRERGAGGRGPVAFAEGREEERMMKMQGGGATEWKQRAPAVQEDRSSRIVLGDSIAGRPALLQRGAPPTTGVAHPISRSASRMAWCVRVRRSGWATIRMVLTSRTPPSPSYYCVRGVCQDVAWTTTSWSLLGPAGRIVDSHAADA